MPLMATRALILDDSSTIRNLLAKILTSLGFETVVAVDGIDGLEAFEREHAAFGLILADWNMPRMNGLEFLTALRARPDGASLPFIMVTTETEIDHMLGALAAGANEYLMKPFTAEMLEAKLRILRVSGH